MMRKVIGIAAALLLSGCNMVMSQQPWFASGDAAQPGMKDGLWVNLKGVDCKFDPAEAIQDWPDCAQPMLVTGGQYRGPGPGADEDKGQLADVAKWDKVDHLLVAGDPLIDQIDLGSGNPDGSHAEDKGFLYLAARAVRRDEQGRIVELLRWPVACGPLPKRSPKAKGMPKAADFVTRQPFPGLTIKDAACTAKDVATLRRAAVLSEQVAEPNHTPPVVSRWVRDRAP